MVTTAVEYPNGWVGLTQEAWNKLYETNTAQWPEWVTVSNGLGFQAAETLRANGIDPNAVPMVMRNGYVIGNILKKVQETIPLTFVEIPDK